MPTLELTDQQVVDLVKQVLPDRKRAFLLSLAAEDRIRIVESKIRRVSSER